MIARTWAVGWVCIVLAISVARGQDTGVTFKAVTGKDNGAAEILDKREAEVRQREGKTATEPLGHSWWLWGLSNIDFDNDGDQDFIVAIHGGGRNGLILKNLLRETGKLTFADATQELGADGITPSADWNPAVWDFDGDGFLDIAGLLNDTPTTALINQGGKGFVKAPFHFHPLNKGPRISDLNGDGYPDAEYHGGQKITFLYDPAGKTFKKTSQPVSMPAGVDEEVRKEFDAVEARFMHPSFKTDHDLNGDGTKDLVMGIFAGYGGPRRGWYLAADKDGKFARMKDCGLPAEGMPAHLQDLDADGNVDVIVVSGADAGLFRGDGKGHFTPVKGPLSDFAKRREMYLQRFFPVDMDNDGDSDLVVSNRRGGAVKVFENLGKCEFREVLGAGGWDADPVVICDIDEDGRMDVVVGGRNNTLTVYLNQTANVGKWIKVQPRMDSPNPFAVDAKVEVFAAGDLGKAGTKPLFVGLANPDGTFVHAGLGAAETVDLRVTFPGTEGKVAEAKGVASGTKWRITPAGKPEELK